jgi:hypothetical protein
VRIKGPDTVRNLKVQIKTGSENRGGYSNANDMRVKTAGGETTRDITINASVFNQNIGRGANGANPAKEAASFQLLLRYPQDLKRERVNFKLKGLDLL